MWIDSEYPYPVSSYEEPVDDPGTDPRAGPFVCVSFNAAWLPYVCGALSQLVNPATWTVKDPVLLADLLARATDLIALTAAASPCVPAESGLVTITILAGDGTASAAVPFAGTYSAPPNVLVACDNLQLAATWDSVSDTGFIANLSASVPVIADTTAHVSWSANT